MVVPLVGTWIEISGSAPPDFKLQMSFPLWERGLKSFVSSLVSIIALVVPLVGTWIEIILRESI